MKPRNQLAGLGKLLQGKTDGLVMNRKKDRFVTETAISKRSNANFRIKISRNTISRRLREINLTNRVAFTKPYISKKNKMSRLKFATEHVICLVKQWNYVYSSDVWKFIRFGCDGRRFVRRSPKERYSPQCTKSSIKFGGGSVMVFGMISAAGTGPLVRLHGKINAAVYKEILKKRVCPNLKTAINQLAVFR